MAHEEPLTGTRLRTPRAAAVAGILFSALLGLALILILISAPSNPATAGAWLSDPARRATLAFALNLVPFAGIAFLWFIGVVRDRIGQLEDRFFASVFLGSGLLFVAMLFVGAAFSGGLLGIAVAVILLVSVGLTLWVELLFPAWILLLSVDILRTGWRRSAGAAMVATDTA